MKIPPALQKEGAFCYIPVHGIAEDTGAALWVAQITMTTSMNVTKQAMGWSTALPQRGCRTLLGRASFKDKELETGWQEWSCPALSGKRTDAMSARPLGFGWGLGYVMYLTWSFCERKSSLLRDIPAINQHGTQQHCQTPAALRDGGKGGLAQPEVPCMGEKKSLLTVPVGTYMFSGLSVPPHVLTGI